MRKIFLALLLTGAAAGTLFSASASSADEYCVRTGLSIGEEPWLAHEECVDCPFEDCPPVPDLPEEPEDFPVHIDISRRA